MAVLISSSGKLPELIAVADAARERGAHVLAITASQSPLARKADAALIVDHVEDVATHLPMISRILHLLVIDMLAVGVAMRRDNAGATGLGFDNVGATRTAAPARAAPRPASAWPRRWRS